VNDPAQQLQVAALSAIRADGGVAAVFARLNPDSPRVRVYEVPPVDANPPYVVLQQGTTTPLLAEGMDLAEVEFTPTVWTLGGADEGPPNLSDCMDLGAAVLAALLAVDEVASWRVLDVKPTRSTYSLDHDGRTARGAIAVQFSLDGI
jgi:hypothetical protein